MSQDLNVCHLRAFPRKGKVNQSPFQANHIFVLWRVHWRSPISNLFLIKQWLHLPLQLIICVSGFHISAFAAARAQKGLRGLENHLRIGDLTLPSLKAEFLSLKTEEQPSLPCPVVVSLLGLEAALKMWMVDNVQVDRMWQIKKYPVWYLLWK